MIETAPEFRVRLFINLAERVGFEPTVRLAAYTHSPGVRLQPLGHLSAIYEYYTLSRMQLILYQPHRVKSGLSGAHSMRPYSMRLPR